MVRHYRLTLGSLFLIVLVGLFIGAQVPSAAAPLGGLIVTRLDDPAPNGCVVNDCSLREAIIDANANADFTMISVPLTGTIELSIAGAGEDTAATGDLDITTEIQLVGVAPEVTIVDANGIDRVFDVLPLPQNRTPEGSDVLISSLTITGGLVESDTDAVGGGVRVQSGLNRIVQLSNVVVRNNDGSGGTFGLGGGVASQGGNLFITGSAIVNNSAENAGGIANIDGAMSISNVTISSNTPRGAVGGIINLANTAGVTSTLGMEAVTIAYNVEGASQGSGAGLDTTVFDGAATTNLRNVIISNNVGDTQCFNGGVVVSNGYNLDTDGSCELINASDIQSTDPLLGALMMGPRAGGGSTYFHNLSNSSPALDSGSTNGTIDQRGNSRPVDLPGIPNTADGDDRGAVEMAAEPPTAVTLSEWNVASDTGNLGYWMVGILLGVGALAVVCGRRS
jgi:hypothetical protein